MDKVVAVLALALAGSACLTPVDDSGETAPVEPEHVAEAMGALTAGERGPKATDPITDGLDGAPDPSKWMSENVPVWNAYLGGLGRDSERSHPDDNDRYAPIIFVRAGDEATPERWLELRLWYHWMMGDAYFEKLVECGLASPLDLLSMRAAIQTHKDQKTRPPSILTLPAATRDAVLALDQQSRSVCPENVSKPFKTFYEERGDFNPFPGVIPGPNNDHTGPGPSAGRGGSNPSKGVTPPPKGKPSRNDPPQTSLLDQKNGVFRGDPKPIPFSNANYNPRLGEKEETFRCNGTIYRGFKRGCVDFRDDSTVSKWDQKMGDFTNRLAADNSNCKRMCALAGGSPTLLSALCIGATIEVAGIPCAYIIIGSTWAGWVGGATFPDWCAQKWCEAPMPDVSRHECKTNPDGKSMTCKKVQ